MEIQQNTDYLNPEYRNFQLTESLQPRNASARQTALLVLQIKCIKMLIQNYIYQLFYVLPVLKVF
jgi:hypothetical protein